MKWRLLLCFLLLFCIIYCRSTKSNLKDVALVDENTNQVYIFKKSGKIIQIKRCVPFPEKLIERRDCDIKPGTRIAEISEDEFRQHLYHALEVSYLVTHSPSKEALEQHQKFLHKKLRNLLEFLETVKGVGENQIPISSIEYRIIDELKARIAEVEYKLKESSTSNSMKEKLDAANKLLNKLIGSMIANIKEFKVLKKVETDKEHAQLYRILSGFVNKIALDLNARFLSTSYPGYISFPVRELKWAFHEELLEPVNDRNYEHRFKIETAEIQATEVTQKAWSSVMGYNPSYHSDKKYCVDFDVQKDICPNLPVESVSFEEVENFIRQLNRLRDGYYYKLPDEVQWVFYASGEFKSTYEDLRSFGWYMGNSNWQTQNVGALESNEIGMYDFHGNVSEWVLPYHYEKLKIVKSDESRPIRGCSWGDHAESCKMTTRITKKVDFRSPMVGFRLIRRRTGNDHIDYISYP